MMLFFSAKVVLSVIVKPPTNPITTTSTYYSSSLTTYTLCEYQQVHASWVIYTVVYCCVESEPQGGRASTTLLLMAFFPWPHVSQKTIASRTNFARHSGLLNRLTNQTHCEYYMPWVDHHVAGVSNAMTMSEPQVVASTSGKLPDHRNAQGGPFRLRVGIITIVPHQQTATACYINSGILLVAPLWVNM